MILYQCGSDNPNNYDLSFIYTKRCDLACPFCMYRSGPNVDDAIDLAALKSWLATVDMKRIASFGVYGGEVAIDIPGFSACLDLVSEWDRPHFVITNGTWSTDFERTMKFLDFCAKYKMFVVVSGTPEHRKHQTRAVIEAIAKDQPDAFRLKPLEENFHAMGRLEGKMPFRCSRKCVRWNRALRIAVQPDGNIIFQNCDGVYPVVGNLGEPFHLIDERIQRMRRGGFRPVCPHF